MDPIRIARTLFDGPTRSFPVRLWDGTLLAPPRDAGVRGCVVLRAPHALRAFAPPSERRLSEAYLDGELALEGDAIGLLEAAAGWDGPRLGRALVPALLAAPLRGGADGPADGPLRARLRGALHSLARDQAAVRHHYDLSDDFYRLFLDRSLVYSCAYFASGRESLEEAQERKLDLVCAKLALAPGERLLDVGCGWGALLERAARRGVEAVGITLSDHQLAEARRRLAALGSGAATVLADDYRRLAPARFDKVASIGMMEHVGRRRLNAYFGAIHRLLVPGGLFLNHAIADVAPGTPTLPWASQREGGFIDRYIFPDHDLVPLALVVRAAERAGFEVRDVESLREHYAQTLAVWLERLEARLGEAIALVGERPTRAYRLYLAASAAAFRVGRIGVYQVLLARRTAAGRAPGLPRCRAAWYPPAWTAQATSTGSSAGSVSSNQ